MTRNQEKFPKYGGSDEKNWENDKKPGGKSKISGSYQKIRKQDQKNGGKSSEMAGMNRIIVGNDPKIWKNEQNLGGMTKN